MRKYLKYFFAFVALVLAVVFLYFVLRTFSWQEAYGSIKILNFGTIAIFVGCVLAVGVIKAYRFYIILKSVGLKTSLWKTIIVFISSQAFTPLPGGEVVRIILFKNKLHLETTRVIAPVYLQAFFELWTATVLALLTILFIKTSFGIWFGIGLSLMLIVISVFILIPGKLQNLLLFLKSKGLKYFWVNKLVEILKVNEEFISKTSGSVRWRLWSIVIGLGLASHITGGFLVWYIAKVQGVNITIVQSIFTAVAAVLIQIILSFIPGGLGVTEGGLIGILTTFGIPWNKSVIITLLYRILTLPVLIIISLLFLLFLYIPNLYRKKPVLIQS
ncbi:MAG: lysylphosphatidylglycerol synthase transmembrane domain-containing protein [Patescibacteria group bacterium]|jgi:hypothetical protein